MAKGPISDSYYVDECDLHDGSDDESQGKATKYHVQTFAGKMKSFISEENLQNQVMELRENLKALRNEMDALKISPNNRISVPIYDTLDDDGNIVEEKCDEHQAISFNRLSVPGGGVNLNLTTKRDVAPSWKMGTFKHLQEK